MPSERSPVNDLIPLIRAGDRVACEELVNQTYAGVYRFLLHLTGDPDMAADFTQETFRSAWQKLAEFDGRASVASWLHRIAYNRFVDGYRKRRRDRGSRENWAQAVSRNGNAIDGCPATNEETSEYLTAAVRKLPEDQRTVVYLHYFEGLSLRETAAVVGQAVGTVKWRLNVALSRLRMIVDPESVR